MSIVWEITVSIILCILFRIISWKEHFSSLYMAPNIAFPFRCILSLPEAFELVLSIRWPL
jgi:hypothetical protein